MNNIFKKGMILILAGAMLFGAAVACGGSKGGSRKASAGLKPMGECTVLASDMINTVALKADGTVYPLGDNYEVRQWKGIVALVANSDVIGLKADGTVISCWGGGDRANGYEAYSQWSDICLP